MKDRPTEIVNASSGREGLSRQGFGQFGQVSPEVLEGWALPIELPPERQIVERSDDADGPVIRFPDWSGAALDSAVDRLAEHLGSARDRVLLSRPVAEIARLIGRAGERFLEEGDPIREAALAALPNSAALSPEMSRVVLDGMARDWCEDRLLEVLRSEFPDPGILDGFRTDSFGRKVRAMGPRLALHIGAGNAPGVSVGSAVASLLVKSSVILKPSMNDIVLPVLFAQALREEAPDLARSMAVLYWPGGDSEIESRLLKKVELVVGYGGLAAIESIRSRLSASTRLVAYHHRVGFGIIGRDALRAAESDDVARRAAQAVALFDQRGCVSPHLFYVESGGEVSGLDWARALAQALDELEDELPPRRPSMTQAVEVQQLRNRVEMERASGLESEVFSAPGRSWTVVVERSPTFEFSCLGRTVRVKILEDLQDGIRAASDLGPYLQSVGVEGLGNRMEEFSDRLAEIGVSRITSVEDMPWPPPWWHHDGLGVLLPLVRWIDWEV